MADIFRNKSFLVESFCNDGTPFVYDTEEAFVKCSLAHSRYGMGVLIVIIILCIGTFVLIVQNKIAKAGLGLLMVALIGACVWYMNSDWIVKSAKSDWSRYRMLRNSGEFGTWMGPTKV